MQQKIMTMLQMQKAMNEKVHSDWVDQNFEWYRAIWIEAAELLDHYGWKWWKKQDPDREQVILELIDIWHFGLSILLSEGESEAAIAAKVENELAITKQDKDFRLLLEAFAMQTLSTKAFDLAHFGSLMGAMDLHFDDLYRSYVGKNVLNFFRQDHGYKDGSYVKVWGGKEDNEHLVELLEEIDANSLDFRQSLYDGLKARYQKLAM